MEARKITIVTTSSSGTKVIMSTAETLRDLKGDLRENGINYDGMDFMEGLTKSKLVSDDSLLPRDVMYKGAPTNELVFQLTTTAKKIRSGADRSRTEAFAEIKRLNLGTAIVNKFGRNYTQVSTVDLNAFLDAQNSPNIRKPEVKTTNKVEETPVTTSCNNNLTKAFRRLVNILRSECAIDDDQVEEIIEILDDGEINITVETTLKPTYASDEIRDMFNF